MGGGYATDDGAALHFVGTGLERVVCSRPGKGAHRVRVEGCEVVEQRIERTYLGATQPALATA